MNRAFALADLDKKKKKKKRRSKKPPSLQPRFEFASKKVRLSNRSNSVPGEKYFFGRGKQDTCILNIARQIAKAMCHLPTSPRGSIEESGTAPDLVGTGGTLWPC